MIIKLFLILFYSIPAVPHVDIQWVNRIEPDSLAGQIVNNDVLLADMLMEKGSNRPLNKEVMTAGLCKTTVRGLL